MRTLLKENSLNSADISIQQYDQIPRPGWLKEFIGKHWILVFTAIFGLYAGLPFLAPIFMHSGWTGVGKGIYLIYSFLCHQLPERSFFFFGPKISYSLQEISATGVNTSDFLELRQFIGNPAMGWKVAWSDRMVSMFTSMVLLGILWQPLKGRIPKLPWWGLLLFLLPMAIDGSSHFVSDLAGIGLGFRESNAWLAAVTGQVFPAGFYTGDAVGSFNSWMRLVTGVLFGLGIVWFGYPYLDKAFLALVKIPRRRAVSQNTSFLTGLDRER